MRLADALELPRPRSRQGQVLAALLWKEWREQRLVVGVALALPVLVPLFLGAVAATLAGSVDPARFLSVTRVMGLMVIVPIFAAVFGAAVMSSDAESRTTGFLMTRPVSRTVIGATKLAFGVGALLATLAMVWLFQRVLALFLVAGTRIVDAALGRLSYRPYGLLVAFRTLLEQEVFALGFALLAFGVAAWVGAGGIRGLPAALMGIAGAAVLRVPLLLIEDAWAALVVCGLVAVILGLGAIRRLTGAAESRDGWRGGT